MLTSEICAWHAEDTEKLKKKMKKCAHEPCTQLLSSLLLADMNTYMKKEFSEHYTVHFGVSLTLNSNGEN